MTTTIHPASPSEAKFRLKLQTSNTTLIVASSGAQALLGFSDAEFLTGRASLPQLIHADDQDIAELLFSFGSSSSEGDFNLRVRQANGRVLCVKVHYRREHSSAEVILDLVLRDSKSLPRTMEQAASMPNFVVMLETTDDYIYFKDRNHVFTGASQSLVALCEPVEHWTDFIGLTDYDVFPEAFADAFYRLEKQVFAGIPVAHEVQETLGTDGTKGWVDNRKYPILDASGAIIGLYGIARDITEIKQAEFNLLRSNNALEEAQRLAQIGNWELDLANNCLKWSAEVFRIFEIDPVQFAETYEAFLDAIHPEDRDAVNQAYTNSLRDRTPYEIIHRVRLGDGRIKWVIEKGVSQFDSTGKPLGSLGTVQDITDRMLAEMALNQSEAKARAIIEASPVPLAVNDESQRITLLNPAFTKLFGYELADIPTLQDWWPKAYPDPAYRQQVAESWRSSLATAAATGEAFEPLELVIRCKDGSDRIALVSAQPLDRDANSSHLVVLHDITQRKRAELELRESQERWQFAVEGTGDGVWDWDVRLGTVQFSKRWKEMLGFAENEIGSSLDEWSKRVHPEDLSRVMTEVESHLESRTPHYASEHRVLCKDGSWKWVLDRGLVISRDANGAALRMIGTHSDIDQRIQKQLELAASQHSLNEAQRLAHLGSWELDAATNHMTWSEELFRIFRMDPGEPALSFPEHERLVSPESWIDLSTAVALALDTGQIYQLELNIIRSDGSKGWIWVRGELVRDARGLTQGLRGVALDISEQREAQYAIDSLSSRLSATLRAMPDMMFELSKDGVIHQYNSDALEQDLLAPPEAFIRRNIREFLPIQAVDSIVLAIEEIEANGRSSGRTYTIDSRKGRRVYEISGSALNSPGIEPRFILVVRDISSRQLSQERTNQILALAALSVEVDEKVLAQKALDALETLTSSKIGFVHLVSEDQQEIELMAWSASTLSSYCHASHDNHYPVATAGIWADSIRTKAPVVINDYAKAENKKGLPEGHSQLLRLISVPLLEKDKVRMVIGVGNADFDYDDEAVKSTQLFGGELYNMIQRIRSRRALERSEHFLKEAQKIAHLGSWELDIPSNQVTWSDELARIYGLDPALPPPPYTEQKSLFEEESWEKLDAAIKHSIATGAPYELELDVIRTDGSRGWLWVRGGAQKDNDGTTTGLRGVALDITPLRRAEASINQLAHYDALTGLANRQHMQRILENAVNDHRKQLMIGGLLMVNLDSFKTINDTLGHDSGDALLIEISDRLQQSVQPGDLVSRHGGDEFVVLLNNLGKTTLQASLALNAIAQTVLERLEDTYVLEKGSYFSTCSIGVTLFGDTNIDSLDLIKQLDIALFDAKTNGGNRISFFDPKLQMLVDDRAQLLNDLRHGIEHHEFEMYYQAQLDKVGSIIGAEALVRWNHPLRGLLSPAEFIPMAESHGLMIKLGDEIMHMCLAQLRRWQDAREFRHLKLSINITADQFYTDGFADRLESSMTALHLDISGVMLEFTESMLLGNIEQARATINRLNERGLRFAIDDFGTGYSSLAYLSELPMDQLKIDQSFVRNIGIKEKDGAIVRTIIDMAKTLDMEVLAEGVENAVQRKYLLQHGCEYFQGYLFSRPLPLKEFNALVIQNAASGT